MQKLVFALFLLPVVGICQTQFEKGYFVGNDGIRVDCLIKNEDWKNNPTKFDYKEGESGEVMRGNIETVSEFAFVPGPRYVRARVDIDYSSDVSEVLKTVDVTTSNLSLKRDPEWKNEVVFLNVSVEGKASLYYWYGDNRARLFYSTSGSAIKQLIYKKYLTEKQDKHPVEVVSTNKSFELYVEMENRDFEQQLGEEVNCGSQTKEQLVSLKYSREELSKFFLEFNQCTGALVTEYTQVDHKREKLHITLRPGLDMSSFEVYTPGLFSVVYSNFSRSANFRLGVEFEYFLQTNRNRWSFFAEPTYRSFVQEYQRGTLVDKITYTSIELPLGARYNAYFGESSKLFISAAWVLDFPFSSELVIQNVRTADIYSSNNFAFGVGYARKKMSVEVRLFTSRNLQKDYVAIANEFNSTSFILGYRLY